MSGQPPAPSPLSDTTEQDEMIWNAVWNATLKGIPDLSGRLVSRNVDAEAMVLTGNLQK